MTELDRPIVVTTPSSSDPTAPGPQLLVSVRSADEAADALAGGAEWVDLKEPDLGPLGAVGVDVARQTVATVAGRAPVSAAGGELLDWMTGSATELLKIEGIRLIKLGLAGCASQRGWLNLWRQAARQIANVGKELVAVAYADWMGADAPTPQQIVAQSAKLGCRTLLLDTFDKTSGCCLDHLPAGELEILLSLAKQADLRCVVAGGLSIESLPVLPERSIDVIAVRGGVCAGPRTGTVQRERVTIFRQAICSRWAETSPL